jgi:hypothetical protein
MNTDFIIQDGSRTLSFTDYDSDNVRAYFGDGRMVYCVQLNDSGLPVLMSCSGFGEPSGEIEDGINYYFEGFDSARWSMIDLVSYFEDLYIGTDSIGKMNELFGGG